MATETFIRLVDDLDGGKAERTVSFSLDGRTFDIDLSKKNINALEKALAPYVAAARRAQPSRRNGSGPKKSSSRPSRSRSDLGAVRQWARANGYEVGDRGRISTTIERAYQAALPRS